MTATISNVSRDDDSHKHEPHVGSASKLNKLRAAVLGANDGIVSIAGLLAGVVGATSNDSVIFTAGLAGLIAGAFSMAAGEYVSVSTQRDSEIALIAKEKLELEKYPEQELKELTQIYRAKGLSQETAESVARDLSAHDALSAHLEAELGIDQDNLTNPLQASVASALAFLAGGVIPFLAIILAPSNQVLVAFVATLVALAILGYVSSHVSGSNKPITIFRVVATGLIAMSLTFIIGHFFGANIA